MSKTKIIKSKFLPIRPPVGLSVVSWLVYKQINPSGTSKGVVLVLFIGWAVLVWVLFVAQLFIADFAEPVFKDDK